MERHLEKTLVLVKPDGVKRGLVGEVIKRFEQRVLRIIGIKIVIPTKEQVEKHYPYDEEWAEEVGQRARENFAKRGIELKETNIEYAEGIRKRLMKYLLNEPVVAMVVEGPHSIEMVRKIIGDTESKKALPGTVRGDFSVDSYAVAEGAERAVKNLIHASDSVKNAEREISVWFDKNEIVDYEYAIRKLAH